jgi:hypothetical protein
MDRQQNIKKVIDDTQPSHERKIALLFMLAMPKSIEKRALEITSEVLAAHGVTAANQTDKNLEITMVLLSVALEQCIRMAKGEYDEQPERKN